MKIGELEERIIERILPTLEKRLKKKLAVKEEYPPETQFKPKFIREVKAAQKRIKEGKGRVYTYEEFKRKFFSKVKR